MTLKTLVTGVAAAAAGGRCSGGCDFHCIRRVCRPRRPCSPSCSTSRCPCSQPLTSPATEDELRAVLDGLAAPGGSFSAQRPVWWKAASASIEGTDRRPVDDKNAAQDGSLPTAFTFDPIDHAGGPGATATVTALWSAARRPSTQTVTFVNARRLEAVARIGATALLSAAWADPIRRCAAPRVGFLGAAAIVAALGLSGMRDESHSRRDVDVVRDDAQHVDRRCPRAGAAAAADCADRRAVPARGPRRARRGKGGPGRTRHRRRCRGAGQVRPGTARTAASRR